MTAWGEMSRAAFGDMSGLSAAQKRVARTAADTLFPSLMPEPPPVTRPEPEPELDGQLDMFGDLA